MFLYDNFPDSKYSELKPHRLLTTLDVLQKRIEERFPGSGLYNVSLELKQVAIATIELVKKLDQPIWVLRTLTFLAIAGLLGLAVWFVILTLPLAATHNVDLTDLLQAAESAINEIIFLSLALFFFTTLENRYKRKIAQRSLHRLRSIAHVVDMHQLTKDPAYLLASGPSTDSSPQRTMTAYELTRYLDYCSELLAIASKLAALHAQHFNDSQVMTSVNEVESLAHGLAGKIWQKIMILDITAPGAGRVQEENSPLTGNVP